MKVAEVMTEDVRSCRPDDTLETAARIMWEVDCGSVPVVDSDGQVVGMITDRDVCMAAWLRGIALGQCAVRDAMARPAVVCNPDDPIEQAQESMRVHRIRRLPVVGGDGRLQGLLSLNDLALAAPSVDNQRRGMRPEAVASTLTAISQHRVAKAA